MTTQIKYSKYQRYIIKLEISKDYLKILNIEDMVTKENIDKIDVLEVNTPYNKSDYEFEDYEDDKYIGEYGNYIGEGDEIMYDIYSNIHDTYEKAFFYDFISNKEYKYFPNGYIGIYKHYNKYGGELRSEYFHVNGVINGKYTEYTVKNGETYILEETNYINGEKHGEYIKYHDNHTIKFKGDYINNKKNRIEYYNKNGKLITIYDFVNGECEKFDKDHSCGSLMQLVAYGAQDVYLR
jgi:antitoxin component YwqK of YwqJK toxin-antitoxin module